MLAICLAGHLRQCNEKPRSFALSALRHCYTKPSVPANVESKMSTVPKDAAVTVEAMRWPTRYEARKNKTVPKDDATRMIPNAKQTTVINMLHDR